MKRQGADVSKLIDVIGKLAAQDVLDRRYLDHDLKGNWRGYRECHLEPDWLLIYKIEGNTLRLDRTGSHSDLFSR